MFYTLCNNELMIWWDSRCKGS